jgi:TRAP-type mannitol/chloroaromatic compound transport system substrate-binding protein
VDSTQNLKGEIKMKRLSFLICFILTIVLIAALTPCTSNAQTTSKVFNWRWANSLGAGDYDADIAVPEVIKFIEKETKGNVKIKHFYAGDIVPAEETLRACGRGTFEIGNGGLQYFMGTDPFFGVVSTPGLFRASVGDAYAFNTYSEAAELIRSQLAKYGVHSIGWNDYGPYPVFCSKVPVRTIADWKGKKVRVSGMSGKLLQQLGASAVFIPGKEIYQALQLGTIDIATYTAEGVKDMHFEDVMKYLILPSFLDHLGGFTFVNQKAWDSLPSEYQSVFYAAQRLYQRMAQNAWQDYYSYNVDPKRRYEVIRLPAKDVAKINQIAIDKVWPEVAAQSPASKQYLDIAKKWYGDPWPDY